VKDLLVNVPVSAAYDQWTQFVDFPQFMGSERYATGAWRGSVNEDAAVDTPTLDEAAASRGDTGKAGVSGKVVAGGRMNEPERRLQLTELA